MKFTATALLVVGSVLATAVTAFAPAPVAFSRGAVASTTSSTTVRFMGPEEDEKPAEEGEFDLDLGEMFEMFDAADKGEDFEKAVEKIKKGAK